MLKPLGWQFRSLHHSPLGQQALGGKPPLGTTAATIAQTFPVLQLALEESESSQTEESFDLNWYKTVSQHSIDSIQDSAQDSAQKAVSSAQNPSIQTQFSESSSSSDSEPSSTLELLHPQITRKPLGAEPALSDRAPLKLIFSIDATAGDQAFSEPISSTEPMTGTAENSIDSIAETPLQRAIDSQLAEAPEPERIDPALNSEPQPTSDSNLQPQTEQVDSTRSDQSLSAASSQRIDLLADQSADSLTNQLPDVSTDSSIHPSTNLIQSAEIESSSDSSLVSDLSQSTQTSLSQPDNQISARLNHTATSAETNVEETVASSENASAPTETTTHSIDRSPDSTHTDPIQSIQAKASPAAESSIDAQRLSAEPDELVSAPFSDLSPEAQSPPSDAPSAAAAITSSSDSVSLQRAASEQNSAETNSNEVSPALIPLSTETFSADFNDASIAKSSAVNPNSPTDIATASTIDALQTTTPEQSSTNPDTAAPIPLTSPVKNEIQPDRVEASSSQPDSASETSDFSQDRPIQLQPDLESSSSDSSIDLNQSKSISAQDLTQTEIQPGAVEFSASETAIHRLSEPIAPAIENPIESNIQRSVDTTTSSSNHQETDRLQSLTDSPKTASTESTALDSITLATTALNSTTLDSTASDLITSDSAALAQRKSDQTSIQSDTTLPQENRLSFVANLEEATENTATEAETSSSEPIPNQLIQQKPAEDSPLQASDTPPHQSSELQAGDSKSLLPNVPDRWSNLSELLGQNDTEPSPWQDTVDSLDAITQPTLQRFTEPSEWAEQAERAEQVERLEEIEETIAPDETTPQPADFKPEATGSQSSSSAGQASEAPPTDKQPTGKESIDAQLDQLAEVIYSRLRPQMMINLERQGAFGIGHSPWMGAVILSDRAGTTPQQMPAATPSATDLNVDTIPAPVALERLTTEIYTLLRYQAELNRERHSTLYR